MTPAKTKSIFRIGADKRTESLAVDTQRLKALAIQVRKGEGESLEFKAKANHPDKIARSLISFANGVGGMLLLGVGDDGDFKGVRYPEEDVASIARILRGSNPRLKWKYEIIALSAKKWLVAFHVSESRRKPIVLRQDKGAVYVRAGDETLQAGPVTCEVLRQRTAMEDQMAFDEKGAALLKSIPETGSISLDGLGLNRLSQQLRTSEKSLVARLGALVSTGVLQIRLEAGRELLSHRLAP